MRLTLRTLLAYLDNTLEPGDANIIREKLTESGFATELVQRIRSSLSNAGLTAPPPDSVHPISEANMISEYLDSTLTSEQISEIERACLESEPHLSEAAACHQILTMVLGKTAHVTDELRQRVYDLPDSAAASGSSAAPARSFSGVEIPADGAGSLQENLPVGDSVLSPTGKPVQPVGPADSGVSDAPTRLRESGNIDDSAELSDPAIAGSRGRLTVSDVYDGTVRPSRITPWLVSLALVAVLAFVLVQIFDPIWNRTAQTDAQNADVREPEVEVPADKAPIMKDVGTPAVEIDPDATAENNVDNGVDNRVDNRVDNGAEDLPLPAPSIDPVTQIDEPANVADPDATPADPKTIPADPEAMPVDPKTIPADPEAMPAPVDPKTVVEPAPSDPLTVDPKVAATDPVAVDPPADPAAVVPPPADPAPVDGLAKVTTAASLLAGRVDDQDWIRVKKDMTVGDRLTMINAPGFRTSMTSAGGTVVTLVSATQAQWKADPAGKQPGISIDFGRALITSKAVETSIAVELAGQALQITMAEPETVVGVEVRHIRQPGFDPQVDKNHIRVARVFSVQGNVELAADGTNHALQTGQQWLMRGSELAPVAAMPALPNWVEPPQPDAGGIEAEGRKALLELLAADQPLTLALREAISFRRSEVGALAAETLLFMGHGRVYFGGDGVLNDAKQRAFWPAHFQALREVVNESAESAAALATAIEEMDAVDVDTLVRLLTGYSQKQLVEGADEELIDLLDSNSMAVRVLALENLREITGTTLYFKPEEENATRRTQDIKKWKARLRKSDIRWNGA